MAFKKVMDISNWNICNDYNAIAKEVDGVIIRSGYRGYGSAGNLTIDPKYIKTAQELYKRGVPVGIYFFTTAISETEARAEADYAVSLIKKAGIEISFPIFVDTEWCNTNHNGRSDNLNKTQRTKYVVAFCERILELGYEPGIYASDSWFRDKLIPDQIKKYKIWNARYSKTKPYIYTTNMVGWQYTSTGVVNGMSAKVDLSEWYGEIKVIKQGSVVSTPTSESVVNNKDTYTVKNGDTLSKIGKNLNLDWKQIAEINGIKSPYRINVGQVLKLPVEDKKEEAKVETPKVEITTSNKDTYTVKNGDTLSKIGKNLNLDWKQIAEINGIKSPYRINVGQVLKLPVIVETPEVKDETVSYPMIRPVSYLQTNAKWKNLLYAVDGEKSTIGSAGCGPTCMAMVLASLVSPYIDPVTTCSWSRMKGYKAKNSGTFYSYLVPQAEEYGVKCRRVNTSNAYHNRSHSAHDEVLAELKKGNWVIACMGVGNWTKNGHFILAYGYKDGMVYINDSASTKAEKECNTFSLFSYEAKYYWVIEVPENIKKTGKIINSGEYRQEDFVREVQYCIGAGLDGKAGNQTLSKTVTVSKKVNNKHAVVLPLQKKLKVLKYYTGELDRCAGTLFDTATKNMQATELKYDKKNQDGEFTAKGKSWKFVLNLI